jgi:hypothetical protein
MAGYARSWVGDISEIKDILQDGYYRGFPILKELVQNADDARATRMAFAWRPGIRNAEHELLRGPAVVVVNNGPFSDRDERGLRSLRVSSKRGDTSLVGRFGIGLTSVYHLCDAFFYVSSGRLTSARARIINPWWSDDGEGPHQNWQDPVAVDQGLLKAAIGPIAASGMDSTDTWFALWLPLRQEKHGEARIRDTFDGDSTAEPAFLAECDKQIGQLLPSLRHVIEIRRLRADHNNATIETRIYLKNERRRFQFPHCGSTTEALHGTVLIKKGSLDPRVLCSFVGREQQQKTPELSALLERPGWPKVLNDQGKQMKEKAEAHGAVLFLCTPKEESDAQFEAQHAVFLPIGDVAKNDRKPLSGPWSIRMLLHGYFFVDPGRKAPFFLDRTGQAPDDDEHRIIRSSWNELIIRQLTSPLMLQTLQDLSQMTAEDGQSHLFSQSDIESLTRTLSETHMFQTNQAAMCAQFSWVNVVIGSRPGFALHSSRLRVFSLPLASETEFKQLLRQSTKWEVTRYLVTLDDSPLLMAGTPSAWSTEAASDLLDRMETGVLHNAKTLSMAALCLERACPDQYREHLSTKLIKFVAMVIRGFHGKAYPQGLVRFLSLIPKHRRFYLSGLTPQLTAHLLDAETSVLVIPSEFDDNPSAFSVLPPDDASKILRHLLSVPANVGLAPVDLQSLTCAVLRAVDFDAAAVIEAHLESKLFVAYQPNERTRFDTLSAKELREAADAGRLFVQDSGLSLEKELAAFIPTLLCIDAEVAQVLSISERRCDTEACFSLLKQSSTSLELRARSVMLTRLIQSTPNRPSASARALVRLLLHGSLVHAEDGRSTLLVPLEAGFRGTWRKLTDCMLTAGKLAWEILEPQIIEQLPRAFWPDYGVGPLDREHVLNELLMLDAPASLLEGLSEAEKRELLLSEVDHELLRQLPIFMHDEPSGHIGPIVSGKTFSQTPFWQSKKPLRGQACVLTRGADAVIQARLEQLAPPLSAAATIKFVRGRLARGVTISSEHALFLLDALDSGDGNSSPLEELQEIDEDCLNWLGKVPWLCPTSSPAAPSQVIHFDRGRGSDFINVDRALAALYAQVPPDFQPPPLRQHVSATLTERQWERLRSCLLPEPKAVERLLAEDLQKLALAKPELIIGPMSEIEMGPILFGDWLAAFSSPRARNIMPAAALLAALSEHAERWKLDEFARRQLVPALSGPISAIRLNQILELIRQEHDSPGTSASKQASLMRVFRLYLGFVTSQQECRSLLRVRPRPQPSDGRGKNVTKPRKKISDVPPGPRLAFLPSQAGTWQDPDVLCVEHLGIAAENILDDECKKLLRAIIKENEVLDEPPLASSHTGSSLEEYEGTVEALEQYFIPWREHLPPEVVGIFFAVLGRNVEPLAGRWLQSPQEITAIRGSIRWDTADVGGTHLQEPAIAIMARQRTCVTVLAAGTKRARSITGCTFDAPLLSADKRADLLVGRCFGTRTFSPGMDANGPLQELQLIKLIPGQYTKDRLLNLLARTVERTLHGLYRRQGTNVEELIQARCQTDQLELGITRAWMLEKAPHYLETLGVRYAPLRQLLKRLDNERRSIFELGKNRDRTDARNWQASMDQLRGERDQGLQELQRMVSEEQGCQNAILSAARRRLEDYSYGRSSIPLELFQNADDAATQWEELSGASSSESRLFRIVELSDGSVAFLHHGRELNQFRFGSREERERDYDRDLERMLVLQGTTKGGEDQTVTGRFGLGFKSVLLVSDRPRIVSGTISFEITGAILPTERHRSDMPEQLQALLASRPVTCIHLPLSDECCRDDMLMGFPVHAPLLTVFAHTLRRIEWQRPTGAVTFEWAPTLIEENHIFRLLVGAWPGPIKAETPAELLVIESTGEARTALVIGLRGGKCVPLPPTSPAVWVTAPTREEADLGVAIHGLFAVDAGRARLAPEDAANSRLAASLSQAFGHALHYLRSAKTQPNSASAPWSTDHDSFWASLFLVCTRCLTSSSTAALILRSVLWTDSAESYLSLLKEPGLLPTGLPTPAPKLTSVDRVEAILDGFLARENVLAAIPESEQVRLSVCLGRHISISTYEAIRPLGLLKEELHQETLESLLERLLSGPLGDIEPERASELKELLDRLKRLLGEGWDQELQRARPHLHRCRFLSRSGSDRRPAEELLAPQLLGSDHEEERLRAAFAPGDRILSDRYRGAALEFALLCRRQFSADTDQLTRWMIEAPEHYRKAALRYLRSGALPVDQRLRSRKNGTWLGTLTHQQLLTQYGFVHNDAMVILGKLDLLQSEELLPSDEPPPHLARRLLENVYSWWKQNREELCANYEQRVFPPNFATQDLHDHGTRGRSAWFVLLALGSFHTIGRTGFEQHRNFLEWCSKESPDWITALMSTETPPETLIELLSNYWDSSTATSKWLQWVLRYPCLYQLGRNLDEYRSVFETMSRENHPFRLDDVTDPQRAAIFQGGGPSVPSIRRVLGLGAPFVIRELHRRKIVTNPHAVPHGFAPVARLRRLLRVLGCPSVEADSQGSVTIWEFLKGLLGPVKATFCGDLDLPLLFLSEDRKLQEDLLGEQIEGEFEDDEATQ